MQPGAEFFDASGLERLKALHVELVQVVETIFLQQSSTQVPESQLELLKAIAASRELLSEQQEARSLWEFACHALKAIACFDQIAGLGEVPSLSGALAALHKLESLQDISWLGDLSQKTDDIKQALETYGKGPQVTQCIITCRGGANPSIEEAKNLIQDTLQRTTHVDFEVETQLEVFQNFQFQTDVANAIILVGRVPGSRSLAEQLQFLKV